ncbi:MAG: phage terminase small subunit [Bacillota bacterium]
MKLAAIAAAAVAASPSAARPKSGPAATEYELKRAELGQDLQQLKQIQSIEKKIELKRQLLPKYDAWVAGVLAAAAQTGRGVQDDVFVQVMIWRIDVGDYEGALPLIAYVLEHGIALPERFKRTAATMIAEEIADAALCAIGQNEPFDLALLQKIDELTAEADMHDEVRAKLKKAQGLELARIAGATEAGSDGPAGGKAAAIAAALTCLKRALQLNERVGVKKEIERLEREAAKLAAPPEA